MRIKNLFQKAERKKIAIGHFNVSNVETFEAAVLASKKTRTPIIIATSEGAIAHSGIEFFVGAKDYYGDRYNIDLYLHLDHGKNLDLIRDAIRKGYDSVMIDASHKPFDENVKLTKLVVGWAHGYGVAVEAELGTIGGAEESLRSRKIQFTDPLEAQEFVDKTNCDFLAVAIGTSHGVHKFLRKSKLNFDLLEQLDRFVDVPLVLHGASSIREEIISKLERYGTKFKKAVGVKNSDIKKAIKLGVRKINIDTDLQLAMMLELRHELKGHPRKIKLYNILQDVRDAMEKEVIRKIKLFSGK